MSKPKTNYDSDALDVLEGVEAIQRRPGMYAGSVDDDAVEVCLREGLDNIIDEAMNGHGDRALVVINSAAGTMTVEDWARGIPVDPHPKFPDLSGLEVVLTKSHSGGKFGDRYGVAGGLHGTGAKVINALSEWLVATVWRDGLEYTLRFEDGRRVGRLESKKLPFKEASRTGTRLHYKLNAARFPDATSTVVPRDRVRKLLRQRSFLNPGVTLELRYDSDEPEVFVQKDGIAAYAAELAGDNPLFKKVAYFDNEAEFPAVRVFMALAWRDGLSQQTLAFCNSVAQREGGTHVTGLKMSLPVVMKKYIDGAKLLAAKDGDMVIDPRDCFDGLQAVVAVRHANPVFKGQDKTSLSNGDVQGAVQRLVNDKLQTWLEENPKEARWIGQRIVVAARAREAAKRAAEGVRKTQSGGLSRSGKLAECSSKDPSICELLVVEGRL